jgi:uncharacterized membrane protein
MYYKNRRSSQHYIPKHAIGFKAKMDNNKNRFERIVDSLTDSFGSIEFLIFNIVFFVGWVVVNGKFIPGFKPFDPFPYNFLTMAVSLEAIFLSIIVLMSQNRAGRIADLREELDLRINIQAEQEITRMLNMINEIHDHLGLKPHHDRELKRMEKKTNVEKISHELLIFKS